METCGSTEETPEAKDFDLDILERSTEPFAMEGEPRHAGSSVAARRAVKQSERSDKTLDIEGEAGQTKTLRSRNSQGGSLEKGQRREGSRIIVHKWMP